MHGLADKHSNMQIIRKSAVLLSFSLLEGAICQYNMEERISNRSIWISSLSLQHLLGCLFLAFACMLVLSLQHLLDFLSLSSICLVVCSLSTAFAWRDLIVKINREGGKCILCEHTFIQDCVRTFHIQCLLEQIELVSSFLFAQIDTRFHYTESTEELAAIFV